MKSTFLSQLYGKTSFSFSTNSLKESTSYVTKIEQEGGHSLAVLVEELDHDERRLDEPVPDLGGERVEAADLAGPEEAAAPAPHRRLVAEPAVTHLPGVP